MKRKVIGIGETVLDIIIKGDNPVGAVPGGSVFNAIVSLGRTGADTVFIGQTGDDRVGRRIMDFMRANNVTTQYMSVYPETKSAISLAFLDDNNDAQYLFYKDHEHDQLEFVYPDIAPGDIVMFGSFYAVNPVIRPQVAGFLEYARKAGAIIYYDVNYRAAHKNEVLRVTPNLLENLEAADFVRGSREDFETLFRMSDPDKVYNAEITFYCRRLIYTDGPRPVRLRAEKGLKKEYPVIPAHTVSTIGAGDNFNAGFVYGLIKYGVTRREIQQGLSAGQWDNIMRCALEFAANCCGSVGGCIDMEFAERKKLGSADATETTHKKTESGE